MGKVLLIPLLFMQMENQDSHIYTVIFGKTRKANKKLIIRTPLTFTIYNTNILVINSVIIARIG